MDLSVTAPAAEPVDRFAAYWPAIRRRHAEELAARAAQRRQALADAHELAAILKARFGATAVLAFGSLVHPERFDEHSDIDLAVDGIQPSQFFKAWAAAAAATTYEFDLVDLADCPPALKRSILEEGIAL